MCASLSEALAGGEGRAARAVVRKGSTCSREGWDEDAYT